MKIKRNQNQKGRKRGRKSIREKNEKKKDKEEEEEKLNTSAGDPDLPQVKDEAKDISLDKRIDKIESLLLKLMEGRDLVPSQEKENKSKVFEGMPEESRDFLENLSKNKSSIAEQTYDINKLIKNAEQEIM